MKTAYEAVLDIRQNKQDNDDPKERKQENCKICDATETLGENRKAEIDADINRAQRIRIQAQQFKKSHPDFDLFMEMNNPLTGQFFC